MIRGINEGDQWRINRHTVSHGGEREKLRMTNFDENSSDKTNSECVYSSRTSTISRNAWAKRVRETRKYVIWYYRVQVLLLGFRETASQLSFCFEMKNRVIAPIDNQSSWAVFALACLLVSSYHRWVLARWRYQKCNVYLDNIVGRKVHPETGE